MHICYRLKVPQVRQIDTPIEHFCIRTFFCLLSLFEWTAMRHSLFLFMVDYDNPKFTLLISASSRTFSRRQSAAIELFTAAATFSVLIHLLVLTQVRGGIGQDSGRVLTRTLGEYFSGGDPVSPPPSDHHGPLLIYTSATPTSRASPTRTSDHRWPC
jgi:hypothetical protein